MYLFWGFEKGYASLKPILVALIGYEISNIGNRTGHQAQKLHGGNLQKGIWESGKSRHPTGIPHKPHSHSTVHSRAEATAVCQSKEDERGAGMSAYRMSKFYFLKS